MNSKQWSILWRLSLGVVFLGCSEDTREPADSEGENGGETDGPENTGEDSVPATEITGPEVDLPEVTGTHYYVDPDNGSDDADGLSPETAWQSMAHVGGGGGFGGGGTVTSGDAVHFLRGSVIEVESVSAPSGVTFTTYGDGPRPIFTGAASVRGNAVMDGLAFKGTTGGTSGVMVSGTGNIVHDCEVDGSDGYFQLGFGIMGEGNRIIGNFVHDISGMTGDSGDMNSSGGAEAYMVMASDNEIAYNSAVNCWGPNQTLGGAEGGCLEIVNGEALSTVENVYFHHNYCERSVGLFEGCSGNFRGTDAIQENHGIIKDSYVAYNLAVDAMWLYLLQPVNTDFINLVFEHNTIIHTPANEEIPQQGASSFGLLVNTDAGYEFTLSPGDIAVRNNLFAVVDGGAGGMFSPPPEGDYYNNLFSPAAPMGVSGVLEAGDVGFTSEWRLTAGSPAVDNGSPDAWQAWTDIDGNTVPCGTAPDIGASELCE